MNVLLTCVHVMGVPNSCMLSFGLFTMHYVGQYQSHDLLAWVNVKLTLVTKCLISQLISVLSSEKIYVSAVWQYVWKCHNVRCRLRYNIQWKCILCNVAFQITCQCQNVYIGTCKLVVTIHLWLRKCIRLVRYLSLISPVRRFFLNMVKCGNVIGTNYTTTQLGQGILV